MASASARPFRFGERWWPEGESDAAALRGRGWYALYIAAIVAFAALLLIHAPPPCTSTLAAAATSDLVAPGVLLLFRGAAFSLVLGVLISLWRKEVTVTLETVDRRDVVLVSSGLWRFQGLTQWQFITIGVYFGLTSGLTYLGMRTPPEALEQQGWDTAAWPPACTAASLLGVALSLALLTTSVTSFVLIPWALKKERASPNPGESKPGEGKPGEGAAQSSNLSSNLAMFFSAEALLMHNANALLLVIDLLLGQLHVDVRDIAYCLLFGATYVFWHQFVRYQRTRTLLYFFLNWQSPHALKILLALLSAIALFFGVGYLLSEHLRGTRWGAQVALLGLLCIMRVRPPPAPHKAE